MNQPRYSGLSGLCQVTEHLYISNGRAAGDSAQLTRCQITCVISVTEGLSCCPPAPAAEIEHLRIQLSDSPLSPLNDLFLPVAKKIQQHAESGGRTLVHCNAGVSRSAALCMAYLMKHQGVTLLEAHTWVKSSRPVVRPNPGFWKQLVCFEKELRGCNSVHMVSSSIGEIPDIYEEEARNMMAL
ncbi:dual specificity protein phosphatase 18-like [Cynoglossus semilaevis]|uniref:dual specificity protein phosphatase 18-like n=1 Tax=Cynoglossus semilaevis TaxID=244447 RepID=UPI000496F709|nr:dual specificity protein phosphatase 18-like [Cynoglossus semilaevis]